MALHLERRAADLSAEIAKLPDDTLLTSINLAVWLAVHPITIKRWHAQGIGPRAIRVGLRALRFKKADVKQWLDGLAGLSSASRAEG